MSWASDCAERIALDRQPMTERQIIAAIEQGVREALEFAATLCDRAQLVGVRQGNLAGDGGVIAARVLGDAIRALASDG